MSRGRWLVDAEGETIHVLPIKDALDHESSDECVCGPSPTPVKREDGSVGWFQTHHSLDGREAEE